MYHTPTPTSAQEYSQDKTLLSLLGAPVNITTTNTNALDKNKEKGKMLFIAHMVSATTCKEKLVGKVETPNIPKACGKLGNVFDKKNPKQLPPHKEYYY